MLEKKWANLCHSIRVEKAFLHITENPIRENDLFLYIIENIFLGKGKRKEKKKRNPYTKANNNWLARKENIWNVSQRTKFPYL